MHTTANAEVPERFDYARELTSLYGLQTIQANTSPHRLVSGALLLSCNACISNYVIFCILLYILSGNVK